jgi:hypothetical protein
MKRNVSVPVHRLNFFTNTEVGLQHTQRSLETEDKLQQREHSTDDVRPSERDDLVPLTWGASFSSMDPILIL